MRLYRNELEQPRYYVIIPLSWGYRESYQNQNRVDMTTYLHTEISYIYHDYDHITNRKNLWKDIFSYFCKGLINIYLTAHT